MQILAIWLLMQVSVMPRFPRLLVQCVSLECSMLVMQSLLCLVLFHAYLSHTVSGITGIRIMNRLIILVFVQNVFLFAVFMDQENAGGGQGTVAVGWSCLGRVCWWEAEGRYSGIAIKLGGID